MKQLLFLPGDYCSRLAPIEKAGTTIAEHFSKAEIDCWRR